MVFDSWKKMVVKGMQLSLAVLLYSGITAAVATTANAEQAAPAAAAAAPAETAPADAAAPAEAAPAPEVLAGNPDIGKALFTGEKRFSNGGPPCISCHTAGIGALGGGALGPDLTMVYADPSKNPLLHVVWVNNPGIPVMGPIFSNKNITEEEMENLKAFFAETAKGGKKSNQSGAFTIIGLGGFIGILIVFNIIWSGRYRNRCKGTAHDALWRNYGGKGGR